MIYKFIDNNDQEIAVNSLSSLQALVDSETIKKNTKIKAGLRGKWVKAESVEDLNFEEKKVEETPKEETEAIGSKADLNDKDDMFDQAALIVVQHQSGSTSLIQRKLRLGYNRSGRIIDQLEAAGIVGQFEGSKARKVLVRDEIELDELIKNMNNNE